MSCHSIRGERLADMLTLGALAAAALLAAARVW